MNKNRLDIMVDIEALGTNSDSTIIQTSAIAFNIITGEHIDFFDECANITKNKEMRVTGSTIEWWLKTNPTLLLDIINRQDQDSVSVITKFYNWMKTLQKGYSLYLWGNGILFDNNMIREQLKLIDYSYPIFYRNDRDVRTIVDLACAKIGVSEEDFKKSFENGDLVTHDGLDDCKLQIEYVSYCYNLLIGSKDVNKQKHTKIVLEVK